MEILVIYVLTLLLTGVIKFGYKMNVIKYLADIGYKLDDYYGFTKLKLIDFVLGVNVINALKKLVNPNFSQIKNSRNVVKMTDDEVFGYRLNPDLIAAFCLNTRCEIANADDALKNKKEKQITINDTNKIVYYTNCIDKTKKYVILSVQGELLSSLDYDEQVSIVSDYYSYVESSLKKYIDESYGGDASLLDDKVLTGEFDYVDFKDKISKEYGKSVEKKLKK